MRKLIIAPWGLTAWLGRASPRLPLTYTLSYSLCKTLACGPTITCTAFLALPQGRPALGDPQCSRAPASSSSLQGIGSCQPHSLECPPSLLYLTISSPPPRWVQRPPLHDAFFRLLRTLSTSIWTSVSFQLGSLDLGAQAVSLSTPS